MLKRCPDRVLDWLIRCSVIEKEDRELYRYALHSFFLLVAPLILAVGIGFCLGSVKHGLVLILPFMVFRKFSGGYHAKNFYACILQSSLLLFFCIGVSMHLQCDWKLIMATGLACVSLLVFSPLDSRERRLSDEEKKAYRKINAFCLLFFGLFNIALFLSGKSTYTVSLSVGIMMTAGLQVPCIVKKYVKGPKKPHKCRLAHKGLKS